MEKNEHANANASVNNSLDGGTVLFSKRYAIVFLPVSFSFFLPFFGCKYSPSEYQVLRTKETNIHQVTITHAHSIIRVYIDLAAKANVTNTKIYRSDKTMKLYPPNAFYYADFNICFCSNWNVDEIGKEKCINGDSHVGLTCAPT